MKRFIQAVRVVVRRGAGRVAATLDRWSGGRLSPDTITWVGLAMHVPIALLIAWGQANVWAAVLLIVFGLFDVLDGELARLQGRASERGMLLDAATDRFKEVLLYVGSAWALVHSPEPEWAVWAVAAVGASLCVSYVKAKGEAAVAVRRQPVEQHQLNRLFQDGLLTFEVRMAILVVALLVGVLGPALVVIALGAGFTAIQRLMRITRALR